METKHKKGSQLSPQDRRHVLAAYVYRFTGDNTPYWVKEKRPNGKPYPLQFATDEEWLKNTVFLVTNSGRLDMRSKHCESTPTWPNGKA